MGTLIKPKETWAEALYQMWQYMSVPGEVVLTESSHWFLELYSVLVTATSKSIKLFNSCQIFNVSEIVSRQVGSCGTC